jgi:hypothetical protein
MRTIHDGVLGADALYLGFTYGGTVYYTSSGSFAAADYPGLRAVRVRVQGGGGAGGGAPATTSPQISGGGGGTAGGWSEKFLHVGDLDASETVTVGAGGTGNSGAAGGAGGTSSFGAHCQATGGAGGVIVAAGTTQVLILGATGGVGSGGDLNARGDTPGAAFRMDGGSRFGGGQGANSPYGSGGSLGLSVTGGAASGFGAGGGGSRQGSGTAGALTGGAGAPGVIIVELMY